MKKAPKNVGASVRARLLRLARDRGDDFQLLLLRYVNERLLYRLATSEHAPRFVLKGAALFTGWTGQPHRATRDVDLLGLGDPSEAAIRDVFASVIATNAIDDGVVFDTTSLEVSQIREDQAYGGVRVVLVARVTAAKVSLQIDVGFGDVITPEALSMEFPPLLDFPAPRLRAYPRETVVAEKVEAMVQLGIANTRMKDFYDVVLLARLFEFDGEILARAMRATFGRRGTPLPTAPPVAFTSVFANDASKRAQWSAFVRKSGALDANDLPTTIAAVVAFVEAPLRGAVGGGPFALRWRPGGPWG